MVSKKVLLLQEGCQTIMLRSSTTKKEEAAKGGDPKAASGKRVEDQNTSHGRRIGCGKGRRGIMSLFPRIPLRSWRFIGFDFVPTFF